MQQQIPNNTGVVKDEISLKEVILSVQAWWKYIRSKWKVIVLAGVIGGVLGIIYSLITPAKYEAEASFVLENADSEGGIASIAAQFGFATGSSGDGLFSDEDNMVTFLKSRTLVSQTLLTPISVDGKSELLIDRLLSFNKFRKKWKSERLKSIIFQPYPNPNSLLADSIITVVHKIVLKRNLVVTKPDKDGNIINVTTKSPDELFSKKFTDLLITNATGFYTSTMTKKSAGNVAILQRQVDSVKALLNMAISGVAENVDQVPNINPAFQRLKVPSQKRLVDVEMNKAILEELVKNLELAKIDLRRQSPLIQIIDSPVLPLERIKVGKLKSFIIGGCLLAVLSICFFTVKRFVLLAVEN